MAKKIQQASLFPVNLEEVWETFIRSTDWDKVSAAEEQDALSQALSKVEQDAKQLEIRKVALIAQITGLPDRAARARKHLEEAAKAMGSFGTEAVLLTSLKESFPPDLYQRTLVALPLDQGAARGDLTPDTSPTRRPTATAETRLENWVLHTLDYEGLTAGQILKVLHKSGVSGQSVTAKQLASATRRMAQRGEIEISGERRSKLYKLAAKG